MNLGGSIHLNKTGLCCLFGVLTIFYLYMSIGHFSKNDVASQKINLKDLLRVAISAAENGGREVVAAKDIHIYKNKSITKEGLPEKVTPADLRSHCAMVTTIRRAFPTVTIISEEAKTDCVEDIKTQTNVPDLSLNLEDQWENVKNIVVWIDPLDATHEYTEKLYQYVTTMVCVAVDGKPTIGVIHKPFLEESLKTSWGWVKKAKSSNLNYLRKSTDNITKVTISRSHQGDIEKILKNNLKDFKFVIAAGSGYKALEVANGNVDAYLHMTMIKKWDICAGNAVINTMNGQMTTKYGEEIDYKDVQHPVNENGLIATIKNHDVFIGTF